MNPELRPANLGEILDRTASLYRSRFLVFVGIAAVPAGGILLFAAGVFLLSAWIGTTDRTMAAVLGLAVVGLVMLAVPVCVALTALGSGALSHAASQAFLGERITIRGAYQAAWSRGWRYVGLLSIEILFLAVIPVTAWVLIFVILFVLAALGRRATGGGFGDFNSGPNAVLLIMGVALVGYFFWMLLRICLAFSASVVEQSGAWASLKRANSLSKGTRGRILVLYLLRGALSWIVSLVLTVPVIIVLSLVPQLNTPQHQQTMGALMLFLFYGSSFASQAFTNPVSGIALMLVYYDQRIRKEAFDIEWMMREAGMEAGPASAVKTALTLPVMEGALPRSESEPQLDNAQQSASGESS